MTDEEVISNMNTLVFVEKQPWEKKCIKIIPLEKNIKTLSKQPQ